MWTQEKLGDLPRDGEFALRGLSVSRLETFVDAAFAFAVTLLVISIDNVPSDYDAFVEALLQAPAFLACFLQLLMFWLGHRTWSRRYGLETNLTLWVSLLLVAVVLIIVYPLKLMLSAGLSFVTDGYLPTNVEFNFEQLRTLFILYGVAFSTLSGLIAVLYWTALQHARWLGLSSTELYLTRAGVASWMIFAATGLLSILMAVFANGIGIIASGFVYMILAVIMPIHRRFITRGLDGLHKGQPADQPA